MFLEAAAFASESGGEAEHELGAVFNIFGIDVFSEITTMWGIMIFMIVLSLMATRNIRKRPTGLQNAMEYIFEQVIGILLDILGREKAKKYLPFLGTMFVFILLANYSGLLPGSGHTLGLKAPTSNLSVTFGLAICTFIATHGFAIREKGLRYFKHFIEPYPFFLPLNILEELTKPLSLSLRLFGNIFGEEMVAAILAGLAPLFLPLPAMFLSVLFGLIQAFVFTLLSAIYISSATEGH